MRTRSPFGTQLPAGLVFALRKELVARRLSLSDAINDAVVAWLARHEPKEAAK